MRQIPALALGVTLLGPVATAAAQSCTVERPEPQPTGHAAGAVLDALGPPTAAVGGPAGRWRVTDRLAHHNVPGVSIAVIHDGRVAWAAAYGRTAADSTGVPVTPHTLFQAASLSKPVTVSAALRLADLRRLRLDQDVNTLLRSWSIPRGPLAGSGPVTVRHLASHTGGITVSGFRGYARGESVPSVRQILGGVAPANSAPIRIDTVPGTRWQYSGGGTVVLQQVIEQTAGVPFGDAMRQLVLQRVGMPRSWYAQPLPTPVACRAARAHTEAGAPVPGGWYVYPELGPAGLWSTPRDVAEWARSISRAYRGERGQLLTPTMARTMLTPVRNEFGLGPAVRGSGDSLYFEHDGANIGYRAKMVVFPALGRGAVVMTNGDNGMAVIEEVMRALANHYSWPAYGTRRVATIPLDSARAAGLVGTYEPTEGRKITANIRWHDGRLEFVAPGLSPVGLLQVRPDQFTGDAMPWQFELRRDAAGVGSSLVVIRDDGRRIEAVRVTP